MSFYLFFSIILDIFAAKELGISEDGIGRVCKNKLKTSGGYVWKYK